jgi:AcrR family transcriptional regulator
LTPGNATEQSGRRQELLEIAGDVFARKGFRNATVRDIAVDAKILSGSLYHHFDSKESMLEGLLRPWMESTRDLYGVIIAEGGAPAVVLERMIRAAVETGEENRREATILHNDFSYLSSHERFAFVDVLYGEIEQLWIRVIDAGAADGTFRPDVNRAITFRIIMAAVLSLVRWFRPDGRLDREEVADEIVEFALRGVLRT